MIQHTSEKKKEKEEKRRKRRKRRRRRRKRGEKEDKSQEQENIVKKLSSGNDMTVTFMNSNQLWLHA